MEQERRRAYNVAQASQQNHRCCGRAITITYFCVCGWVGVRGYTDAGVGVCWRTCSLTKPASTVPPYCHVRPPWLHWFFDISHKRHDFRKKLLNIKRVFFLYNFHLKHFSLLRIIQQDFVINVKTFSRKVTVILVGF